MTEPRDSARFGPEDDGEEARPAPSRGFARLVESPAARRLALPKLAGAVAAGLLVLGLAWFGLTRISRSVIDYVDAQAQHQVAFAEIELVPEPPPWIRTGSAGILHRVRIEARREERLSVPAVDLKELEKDFRRCPWVEGVRSVERSYGRLSVHLAYRKPVAVAEFDTDKDLAVVIDGDGVILPAGDIAWAEKSRKGAIFRARGIDEPLTMIRGVRPPASLREGLPWKQAGATDELDGRDSRVRGAARLAEFLRRHPEPTPAGKPAPKVAWIQPEAETLGFFLKTQEDYWIFWDHAPGAEPPGEPSSEEMWKLLLDWVDRHGELKARSPHFLQFFRSGWELVPIQPPSKGAGRT